MNGTNLASLTIEPNEQGEFTAFVSVHGLLALQDDPQSVLQEAAQLYQDQMDTMRLLIAEMHSYRIERRLVPARKMWKLGDAIFDLRDRLGRLSLELDDLYWHLVRDLNVKRKWLEKAIIFRRYLPCERMIPESLNWGRCEKGTRRIAERMRDGFIP